VTIWRRAPHKSASQPGCRQQRLPWRALSVPLRRAPSARSRLRTKTAEWTAHLERMRCAYDGDNPFLYRREVPGRRRSMTLTRSCGESSLERPMVLRPAGMHNVSEGHPPVASSTTLGPSGLDHDVPDFGPAVIPSAPLGPFPCITGPSPGPTLSDPPGHSNAYTMGDDHPVTEVEGLRPVTTVPTP